MPKVKTDERFARVMKFLMASTELKIAKLLALRGFTDEDRQEGWALLDQAAGRHMQITSTGGTFQTQYRPVLEALDDWENTWFDVADAALVRQYPGVHAEVFKNLSKTSGNAVLLSVKTFLERIDSLNADESDESASAVQLLEKRGLIAERLDEAAALIEKITSVQDVEAEDDGAAQEALKAEREAAVKEMWAWYLDWAQTARTVVKNKNYRVMLGLTAHRARGTEVTDEEANALDEEDDSVEQALSGN